jgi:hypothetical protein
MKTKQKTISPKVKAKIRTLVASEKSIDGGIVWDLSEIHIEVKGEPTVFDFSELSGGTPRKPNTLMRHCFKRIPAKGFQVEHIQMKTKEELAKIKQNPDLMRILLDSLEWSEPYNPDDLNWSSVQYVTVK